MCTSDRPESRVPSPESGVAGPRPSGQGQAGLTLVELVIFIVVVSVGVAGILSVMNLTTSHSADPLVRKQALAIAEALLEEIDLQPFTDCDPDAYDPVAGSCTLAEVMGPEEGEARGSFDNVNDYSGFAMAGITSLADGNAIPGLGGYDAAVAVAGVTLGGAPALQITVTVTGTGGTSVTLDGYRTEYAPRG